MKRFLSCVVGWLMLASPIFAMDQSAVPPKFPIPWAQSAGSAYIRSIPQNSQIGIVNCAASLTDGFPPLTFIPATAGGCPPFGQDFNGILKQLSQWSQWQAAGGPILYDSGFQASIGGYPNGALIQSVATPGFLWRSTVNGNTSNPDTGGAGWAPSQANVIFPATGVQLQPTSSSLITLAPVNGGYLWINGVNYGVGSGVTLGPGGLSAGTNYFIYAFLNAGVITLEASTTSYTFNANGIPQKTGDASRTFVGTALVNSGPSWSSTNPPAVTSYFNPAAVAVPPQTGAQLQLTSASILTLTPLNGGYLWINGTNYQVPPGLTITPGPLAVGQTYFIYALISGNTMILEASTTGYTIASNGIPQKTGDVTRTLVGQGMVTTGPSWPAFPTQVLSYFNRVQKSNATFFGGASGRGQPLGEISATIRNTFLAWPDEDVQISASGEFSIATAADAVMTAIAVDGALTTPNVSQTSTVYQQTTGVSFGMAMSYRLAIGSHYATLWGQTASGVLAGWFGGSVVGVNSSPCILFVTVKG